MADFAPYESGVIQLGREATPGTLVPATTIWPGAWADIKDIRVRRRIKQNIGVSNPSARWKDVYLGGRLAMPKTSVAFETVPHIMEASIKAATPGSAPAYTRTYNNAVDNSLPALKYYTVEAGLASIANGAAAMPFGFVEDWELTGEAGEDGTPWEISANWRGARKIVQALTPALTVPAVTDAVFNDTTMYIDNSGTAVGTAAKTNRIKSAKISYKSNRRPVPAANGLRYYSAVKPVPKEGQITWEFVYEVEDITGLVAAERTAFENNTMRLIRLDTPGPDANHNFRIDLAGYYTDFGTVEDDDGNAIIRVQGQCEVSVTDALYFTVEVKNAVAVLP